MTTATLRWTRILGKLAFAMLNGGATLLVWCARNDGLADPEGFVRNYLARQLSRDPSK